MSPPGSTKESSPKGKSSSAVAEGFLQKGQHSTQKGVILPSALPQNLLPLLGRGLSISSLPGSHSLEQQSGGLPRRVKPPASAAVSGRGSDPTEIPPMDTHAETPHTQTHTPEQEAEITTVGTMQDVDTETGAPAAGRMSKHGGLNLSQWLNMTKADAPVHYCGPLHLAGIFPFLATLYSYFLIVEVGVE